MNWLGVWRASTLICDPLYFGLRLNAQKTQMICMGTSKRVRTVKTYVNSNTIQFMGISFEFQECVRSLGMVLDERLTWTAHTNDIIKTVNFRLKHLSTFRYVLNEDVKKGLVAALVQPISDYGDCSTPTRVVTTK
jgi:hypothetical protein